MKNLVVKLVNDYKEMDTTPYSNARFKVDKVKKGKKVFYFLTKEVTARRIHNETR